MKGGEGRGQRVRNKSMVSPGVWEREQQRLGRRAQAGSGWTAGPHHPWRQTVRPTETGQEGLAADPAEEHGCTSQPSPSKWTDGHSANQPGLTGAHQASACHSAHRERGRGAWPRSRRQAFRAWPQLCVCSKYRWGDVLVEGSPEW